MGNTRGNPEALKAFQEKRSSIKLNSHLTKRHQAKSLRLPADTTNLSKSQRLEAAALRAALPTNAVLMRATRQDATLSRGRTVGATGHSKGQVARPATAAQRAVAAATSIRMERRADGCTDADATVLPARAPREPCDLAVRTPTPRAVSPPGQARATSTAVTLDARCSAPSCCCSSAVVTIDGGEQQHVDGQNKLCVSGLSSMTAERALMRATRHQQKEQDQLQQQHEQQREQLQEQQQEGVPPTTRSSGRTTAPEPAEAADAPPQARARLQRIDPPPEAPPEPVAFEVRVQPATMASNSQQLQQLQLARAQDVEALLTGGMAPGDEGRIRQSGTGSWARAGRRRQRVSTRRSGRASRGFGTTAKVQWLTVSRWPAIMAGAGARGVR